MCLLKVVLTVLAVSACAKAPGFGCPAGEEDHEVLVNENRLECEWMAIKRARDAEALQSKANKHFISHPGAFVSKELLDGLETEDLQGVFGAFSRTSVKSTLYKIQQALYAKAGWSSSLAITRAAENLTLSDPDQTFSTNTALARLSAREFAVVAAFCTQKVYWEGEKVCLCSTKKPDPKGVLSIRKKLIGLLIAAGADEECLGRYKIDGKLDDSKNATFLMTVLNTVPPARGEALCAAEFDEDSYPSAKDAYDMFGYLLAKYHGDMERANWCADTVGAMKNPDNRKLEEPKYLEYIAVHIMQSGATRSGALRIAGKSGAVGAEAVRKVIREGTVRERVTLVDNIGDGLLPKFLLDWAKVQYGAVNPAVKYTKVTPAVCFPEMQEIYNTTHPTPYTAFKSISANDGAFEPEWFKKAQAAGAITDFADESITAAVNAVMEMEIAPVYTWLKGDSTRAIDGDTSIGFIRSCINVKFVEYKYKTQFVCAQLARGDSKEKSDFVHVHGTSALKGILSPNSMNVILARRPNGEDSARGKLDRGNCDKQGLASAEFKEHILLGDLGKMGNPGQLTEREKEAVLEQLRWSQGAKALHDTMEAPWDAGRKMNVMLNTKAGQVMFEMFGENGAEMAAGPSGTTDGLLSAMALMNVDREVDFVGARLGMAIAVVPFMHHSIFEVFVGGEFFVEDQYAAAMKQMKTGMTCVEPYLHFGDCGNDTECEAGGLKSGGTGEYSDFDKAVLTALKEIENDMYSVQDDDMYKTLLSPCGMLSGLGSIQAACEAARYEPVMCMVKESSLYLAHQMNEFGTALRAQNRAALTQAEKGNRTITETPRDKVYALCRKHFGRNWDSVSPRAGFRLLLTKTHEKGEPAQHSVMQELHQVSAADENAREQAADDAKAEETSSSSPAARSDGGSQDAAPGTAQSLLEVSRKFFNRLLRAQP